MNVKTMEGLAGASTSISMISTPMNVAKEAERKGDTDKMKRALGYAAGVRQQAEEYGDKAEQGMKLDGKEAKEQEKLRQEKLIEARRDERREQEEQIEQQSGAGDGPNVDTAEISQEGKSQIQAEGQPSMEQASDVQDMTYDKSGEAAEAVQETGELVDVTA